MTARYKNGVRTEIVLYAYSKYRYAYFKAIIIERKKIVIKKGENHEKN